VKRAAALVPLALAVTALASACGGSSGSSSTTTSGGSASTTAAAAPTTTASAGATTTAAAGSTTTMGSSGSSASMKTGNPSSPVTLNESGSSLLYPFLQELVTPLKGQYSNVTLAPAAGGSGKGISDAASGTTQFGGSDAYLSPGDFQQYQGLENIPIVVSGQAINYNLKGVTNLKLDGAVLAGIYEGKITTWNDPKIAALNTGVTLPSEKIVPVRRSDSSGDTFLFTSLLTKTDPTTWGASSGPQYGTTVTWPSVSSELTADGNPGMVQTCSTTPGCIAYVGVSAESAAQSAGLGEAELQNASGQFLMPTAATLTAAANAVASSVPSNLVQSLIYTSGAQSYPIANFEYIIVNQKQSSATTAQAIRDFLSFAIDPSGGSTSQYLSKEDFVGLPSTVLPKVESAIAGIGS
jgi:phosphate transport system substrate-binding protein